MVIDTTKYYIFYDGDCAFCNHWVHWILDRDDKDLFLFVSLQSEFGQSFLKERELPCQDFDTIYIWKPEKYYLVKSVAILDIFRLLGGKYYWLYKLNFLSNNITDFIYTKVANRRKKLMKNCKLPTEKQCRKIIS